MNQRKLSTLFLLGFAIFSGFLVLLCPQEASEGFASGIALCLHSVLPGIFPFMVTCNLVVACPYSSTLGLPLRPLTAFCGLKAKPSPLILLLSWVGGYAVCAQCIARYRRQGQITGSEAMLLLLLGCCSGPGFVIGCVGGLLLHSLTLGVLLYFLQIAANFLSTAFLWPFLRRHVYAQPPASRQKSPAASAFSLSGAISEAVTASLSICGCILFFRVLSSVLLSFLSQADAWGASVCSGFFEISAGCSDFAAQPGADGLYGVAACLGFLGLSVYAQLQTLLDGAVPIVPLILSRLLHMVWMQALLRLCLHYMPGEATVFSSLAPRVIVMNRAAPDAVLIIFCFLCAVLYKGKKSFYNKM